MFTTWFGRATLGRIEGEELDNMAMSTDLVKIWTHVLTNAGYEPSGQLADFFWQEGYPDHVIKAKATLKNETLRDVGEYFARGMDNNVEDFALDNGIESALEAYFSGVPLEDIIA